MIVLVTEAPPAGWALLLSEETLAKTGPTEDMATDCAHQLDPWQKERVMLKINNNDHLGS